MAVADTLKFIHKCAWFAKHEVSFSSDSRIVWRQPGTSIYYVVYVIEGCFLIVLGDLGEAVYRWSEKIDWKFLNGLDFSYFHGKCRASPGGVPWEEWSSEDCNKRLRDMFNENESLDKGHLEECLRWTHSESSWNTFMQESGCEIFGSDWWEVQFGKVPALGCVWHWHGLKLATDIVLGRKAGDGIIHAPAARLPRGDEGGGQGA